ncbi:MAG TPA: patatin-like phospholipase family protein [Pyrinomonadaceae bacterium]|nr:patatin-like phospholipase family protein [Pyrinomonadaceae bacterium]
MLFKSALIFLVLAVFAGCAATPPAPPVVEPVGEEITSPEPPPPPKIALVLGGGAAKGFAHIGVIKALESHAITPDIIIGTSAGSVVGALYAGGYNGFDLQRVALSMDEGTVSDWVLPNRGFIKGESLQKFVNNAVQNRPIEALNRTLAVVATDLQSGELVVFERGDTGMAVRASSSVPGIFRPVMINGREYVDGGLVSPVPVKTARDLGADIVIAVDISDRPKTARLRDTIDVLMQTFIIMGRTIASQELTRADIVVVPDITNLNSTNFDSRNYAIIEGEKAGLAAVPKLQEKVAAYYESKKTAVPR